MSSWFSHFERRRWLALALLLAGAGLAFLSPWHALPALALAALLLVLPAASGRQEFEALNGLLKKVKDGELVHRMPRSIADPLLDEIRININSSLDQTE